MDVSAVITSVSNPAAQEAHRQLWMVFNFLFTVVGSFVFGYFAAFYAGFELAWVSKDLLLGFYFIFFIF